MLGMQAVSRQHGARISRIRSRSLQGGQVEQSATDLVPTPRLRHRMRKPIFPHILRRHRAARPPRRHSHTARAPLGRRSGSARGSLVARSGAARAPSAAGSTSGTPRGPALGPDYRPNIRRSRPTSRRTRLKLGTHGGTEVGRTHLKCCQIRVGRRRTQGWPIHGHRW